MLGMSLLSWDTSFSRGEVTAARLLMHQEWCVQALDLARVLSALIP